MYVNYPEISELYHFGIKGQKWGIIRKKDDQETRLASEKNRLKYDEKIAQLKSEADTSREINQINTKTTITLGKQSLKEALEKEKTIRQQSEDARVVSEQKYKMIGKVALATVTAIKLFSKSNKK